VSLDLLLDARLPVLVQGITGRAGSQHAVAMRAYGTHVVGGVGSREGDVEGIPVYRRCSEAVVHTGAQASVVMVPPVAVRDAVVEAIDAGVRLVVIVTEGVPVHDALAIVRHARAHGATCIGASTAGLAIPGRMKLGFLPDVSLAPGPLGVMSKSGTLAYEVCWRLATRGVGQSVWIGVGGDAVKGTRFGDCVPFFARHRETRALLMIGEIGGDEEETFAARLVAERFAKPVYALLAGSTAPEGVTMGHAGAIAGAGTGTIASKRTALEAAGVRVFTSMNALVSAAGEDLGR